MKKIRLFFFLFPFVAHSQTFNITQFGAKPDGKTLATKAIQTAIDKASFKGGTVIIPSGEYLSGSLILKSNVHLRLEMGAILRGSKNIKDYTKFVDEDTILHKGELNRHFIFAKNVENISITGNGIIDGNGLVFWDKNATDNNDIERPTPWIKIQQGKHISIEGLTFSNSSAHVLVFNRCKDVKVRGITINNPFDSQNTDGIDITDTKDVIISDCNISTGDDAICLKSHLDTVENIVVTNCIIRSDDAALKFGTGGMVAIRNCTFSNIIITNTRYGIAMFMKDGGVFENTLFSNIIIETQSRHNTEYPIYVDIDRRDERHERGTIRNISFKDIKIKSRGNILIGGQAQNLIQDLTFDNIDWQIPDFSNLEKLTSKPRGNRKHKPYPGFDDFSKMPSNFTLAHINGLVMKNISVSYLTEKLPFERHLLYFKNAKNVTLDNVKGEATGKKERIFKDETSVIIVK
jgi:polygalacturonase